MSIKKIVLLSSFFFFSFIILSQEFFIENFIGVNKQLKIDTVRTHRTRPAEGGTTFLHGLRFGYEGERISTKVGISSEFKRYIFEKAKCESCGDSPVPVSMRDEIKLQYVTLSAALGYKVLRTKKITVTPYFSLLFYRHIADENYSSYTIVDYPLSASPSFGAAGISVDILFHISDKLNIMLSPNYNYNYNLEPRYYRGFTPSGGNITTVIGLKFNL